MRPLAVSKRVAMYEEALTPDADPVVIPFGATVEHVAMAVTGGNVYAEWNDDEITATASHYLDGEIWSMDVLAERVTVSPDPANVGTVTVRVQTLEDGE